jgi:alpha-L-rhamnosidase
MKQKHTLLAFALLCMQLVNAQVKVSALRCEMLVNPLGIDVKEPRLSWELVSEERHTANWVSNPCCLNKRKIG